MISFSANGLRFAALEWGTTGPLVLLVHGFPDTPHSWNVLGPKLADQGFRVVAPFLRGYAPSELPSSDTTAQELGEDVLAWIAALGEKRAHVIGHDWGAEAVYAAAGLATDQLISLTAIGIPHRAALLPGPRIAWGLRHFVTFKMPNAAATFARDDYAYIEVLLRRWSPTWKFTSAELEEIKHAFRQPGTANAALGYYRAAGVLTPKCMKAPVRVRSLLVGGSDDPAVTPANYESTRSHFPGGFELLIIPGGHFCHRESPDQLFPKLINHLQR